MIKSFTFRLTLGVAFTIILATSIVLVGSGWLLAKQYLREMDRWLASESRQLATILNGARPGSTNAELAAYIAAKLATDGDHTLYFIQIAAPNRDILYRSANLGTATLPDAPADTTYWTTNLPRISNMRITELSTPAWRIRVGLPTDDRETILNSYIKVSLLIFAATIAGSLIVGYAYSRYALAPLHAIEESARRIRASNLQERVYLPKNNRELASLATEFNRAFDDLETAFAQIRRFSADASHELKTPLTLIRLNAEKLRDQLATSPACALGDTSLSNILEEADRMQRIIESLLFITRVEAGALDIECAPNDIQKFIADFTEDARILAESKNVRFEIGHDAPGAPAYNPSTLRQLLLNLTSNAINASPPGGTITLDSAPRPQGGWRLVITDEGPGLPESAFEHIFTRFWRYQYPTPANASKTSAGHGLGLSIAKSIAILHKGTLHAENRPDRPGLRITFEW